MMDLVWIKSDSPEDSPNKVVLVEINPFDGEGLGAFPASTGLFNWDDAGDRRVMMGESESGLLSGDADPNFTLRLCTAMPNARRMEANKNPAWVKLIKEAN
jgi:hypothetical protein